MTQVTTDATTPAALARSVLACPRTVELVVDGRPGVAADERLSLSDADGTPTFGCLEGSPMALAGDEGRRALLVLTSALGGPTDPVRAARVTLAGRLRTRSVRACACCADVHHTVTLGLDRIVVAGAPDGSGHVTPGSSVTVALEDYRHPALALNAGHLQRTGAHAEAHHQDELRLAVARATGRPVGRIAGVGLSGLTTTSVDIAWVDEDGAHRLTRRFRSPAATPTELADRLREELHTGVA